MALGDQEISDLIKRQIEKDEKIGMQSGGSGHLADVGYRIDRIETDKMPDGHIEITYYYILEIISEFSVYPDNPGYTYNYKKTITVDKNRMVHSVGKKETYHPGELDPPDEDS